MNGRGETTTAIIHQAPHHIESVPGPGPDRRPKPALVGQGPVGDTDRAALRRRHRMIVRPEAAHGRTTQPTRLTPGQHLHAANRARRSSITS